MATTAVELVVQTVGGRKLKELDADFKKVEKAVKGTDKALEAVQTEFTKTGRALQTASNGLKYWTDAAGRARKANGRFVTTAEQVAAGIDKTGNAARRASGPINKLSQGFGGLKIAIGALALGFIAKQLLDVTNAAIRSTGEIQKLEAAFTSLTGSSEAAAELRNQLFQLSKTTPFPNEDLQTAARRFLAVGIEVENIEGTINRVGALAAQSGQDLNRLGLIYAQVYAKGRLQGEENLQFLEAGIDLTDELGKVTGLTGQALRDAMSKGQVSVGNVNDAIKLATGEMTVLDLAAKAVDVQLDNIGDNVGQVALGFNSALAPAFASVFGVINEAFDLLFPSLESVQELFKPLLEQSERFAELLEGNPALVDAIAQVFESLIAFGINPAVQGLEDMNTELEQNPQGLINLIYDIEAAIRQALLAAKGLVQVLSGAAKLSYGLAQLKAGKGFGAIKGGIEDLIGVGSTIGEIGSVERLQPRPIQPRTENGNRNGNLQDRPDSANSGDKKGGGNGAARKAAAAAAKAAREAQRFQEQLEKQLKTSEKLLFNADNRLRVASAITEQDRLELEGKFKIDEIARKYDELLEKQKSDAEVLNLLDAKKLETDLAILETEEALSDLREGAVGPIQDEIELMKAKLDGTEKELIMRREIAALTKNGSVSEGEATNLVKTKNALEKQIEAQDKAKASAEELAGSIASSLTGSLRGLIDGSKTAEQALSDAFSGIADAFLDMAMKMIQEWIKMQVIGLVGSLFGGGPSAASGAQGIGAAAIPGLATGGTANGGQPYIVGEEGPELFIPGVTGTVTNNDQFEAARNAMSGGSSPGADGSVSSDSAGVSSAFAENTSSITTTNSYMRERSMERSSQTTVGGGGSLVVETQVINNVEYATVEQMQLASAASAKQARAEVFRDLRNKPAARASVGMR